MCCHKCLRPPTSSWSGSLSTTCSGNYTLAAVLLISMCVPVLVFWGAGPLAHGVTQRRLGDGCFHVYVDLGTNIGVQFRKLYEPDAFPGAPILPVFDNYFGPGNRSDVCSFGFEPNPRHVVALEAVVARYTRPGRIVSVERAAAGCADAGGQFIPDTTPDAQANAEWGAAVKALPPGASAPDSGSIRVIDIVAWLDLHVFRRRLPSVGDLEHMSEQGPYSPSQSPQSTKNPTLVMKIDIEGADEGVLRCLLDRGALCAFSYVYYEGKHIPGGVAGELQAALVAAGCKTRLADLDDETYNTVGWDPNGP